ncbi:MAG: hypothetical protein AAFW73_13595 [Bacteroidota bacterium]
MYYLPIVINNRRTHICKLGKPGWQEKERSVPHFTIDYGDETGSATVLKIERDAKFFSDAGIADDKALRGEWFVGTSYTDPNAVVIELQHNPVGRPLTASGVNAVAKMAGNPLHHFSIAAESDDLVLKFQTLKNNGRETDEPARRDFKVIIKLTATPKHSNGIMRQATQQSFEYHLQFHFAPSQKLYHLVLDFGSDSSQMGYLSPDNETTFIPVPLLQTLKDCFRDNSQDSPDIERFLQFDSSNPREANKLLRSNFFLRRDGGRFMVYQQPFEYTHQEEGDLLEILKTPAEVENELVPPIIPPNPKITEHIDDSNFSLQLNGKKRYYTDIKAYIFRSILNHLFHTFLARISDGTLEDLDALDPLARPERDDGLPTRLRVTLLVPNIYSQGRVIELMEQFRFDAQAICDRYGDRWSIGFQGIEVQVLSESDASFLGLMNQLKDTLQDERQLERGSKSLVIDGGKGTIDISALRKEDKDTYSSIYRGGCAGAGGVLTYAFLETLAALVVGESPSRRKKFIYGVLSSGLSERTKIMNTLEELKALYDDRHPQLSREAFASDRVLQELQVDLNRHLDADNFSLFGQDLIEMLRRIRSDDQSLADGYGIIQQAIDTIVENINEVLDRIEPGKDRAEQVGQFSLVLFSGRAFRLNAFRVAVEQSLRQRYGNFEAIWNSYKAKTACLLAPVNVPTALRCSDLIGEPMVLDHSPEEAPKLNRADRWIAKIFPGNAEKSPSPSIENFFKRGLPIRDLRSTVWIGGFSYEPKGLLKGGSTSGDVIYTGQGFLLRTDSESVALMPPKRIKGEESTRDVELIWRSIFPNIYNENKESLLKGIPVSLLDRATFENS